MGARPQQTGRASTPPSIFRLPALPRAVVGHVEVVARERLLERRVEQDEVGVAARREHALRGIQAEDARGVGRGDRGEALERHAALDDALGPRDPQARLGADVAAGDVLDRPAPELQREARGVLVGRERGDALADEPAPERLLVLGELERGIGVRAEAARLLVVLGVEARVLVERLGVRGQARRPRLADGLHALARRGVDEVDGAARRAREREGAPEGEQLGELGVDQVEVRPVQAPLGAEALVVPLDEVLVLPVDGQDAAVPRDPLHRVSDAPEVEPGAGAPGVRRQDVGREGLEARRAALDRLADLLEDGELEGAAEGDVEGVVHVRVALPAGGPLLERRRDRGAGAHVAEVDVRGRAAVGHAARVVLGPERDARLVGVAHDRVRQVRVGLDAAWGHDEPRRVEDPRARGGERARLRDDRDPLAADADVAEPRAAGGDDRAAAHHEVECHRSVLPRAAARRPSRRPRIARSGIIRPSC